MASELEILAQQVTATYAREKSRLVALKAAGIGTGEKKNIAQIERMVSDLQGVIRRFRSDDNRDLAL
jgi:hypothetical protein